MATEENQFYGLDARTGRQGAGAPDSVTRSRSGSYACGNIDPLGVTGTPAYDAGAGRVSSPPRPAAGGTPCGPRRLRPGAAVAPGPGHPARAESQGRAGARSLLVEPRRGRRQFGGLAGDPDNYVGYVASRSRRRRGRHNYAVPTAREAGIWSPPVPVTAARGTVYVASGNGAEVEPGVRERRLGHRAEPGKMHRRSISRRLLGATTTPGTWTSAPWPPLVPALHRVVMAGKRGAVYLLGAPRRDRLGGEDVSTSSHRLRRRRRPRALGPS